MVVKSKISISFWSTENSGYKEKIIEKPQINFNVNAGIYVLDHGVAKFKKNFFHMTELFQNLINQKRGHYPIFENWKIYRIDLKIMKKYLLQALVGLLVLIY